MAATSPSPASTDAGARPAPARVAFVGAALFVFTDGPLFFLAHRVLDRPGPSWHDVVVAGGLTATAATAGMLVLWSLWRTRLRSPQPPHPKAAAAVVFFVLITAASTAWKRRRASHGMALGGLRRSGHAGLAGRRPGGRGVEAAGADGRRWRGRQRSGGGRRYRRRRERRLAGHLPQPQPAGARGRHRGYCGRAPASGPRPIPSSRGPDAGRRIAGGDGRRGSRTAWLALGAGAGFPALPVLRKHLARRWGEARARAVAWTALGAGTAAATAALAALWNTPTLAQRRTIWRVSWEQFLERPLHGHGFSAIWTWPEFLDNHELLDRGSAHSGPLEAGSGSRAAGLVPFAVVVVLAVRNAGRDLLRSPSAARGCGPRWWR